MPRGGGCAIISLMVSRDKERGQEMVRTLINQNEREELHRTIWKIANDLRGAVDGWDFKQYVLCTIFYRYLSESFCDYVNKRERDAGNENFDYSKLSNEEVPDDLKKMTVTDKGYYISPGDLFSNVCKAAQKDNSKLNTELQEIFRRIEKSSRKDIDKNNNKLPPCMEGLFGDFDASSKKLSSGGNAGTEHSLICKKLTSVLLAVRDMKLGSVEETGIDTYGDAYEYLMAMYASSAGKSGGEFYTPQEVSQLLARLTLEGQEDRVKSVYDPACGSGGLLLQFVKILKKRKGELRIFGQEINITTYNLCRMNMFLHGVDPANFFIRLGDTLTEPAFIPRNEDDDKKIEYFDAVVSNPPYSIKWKGKDDSILINDPRYRDAAILAPQGKADLAFIETALFHLKETGVAAIVCFPGVLYRGGAEEKIREYLLDNNYIDTIIALPSNLFFGTSIATCIMVLKKCKTNDPNVLFIDASAEFVKVTNNNKLTDENISNILGLFCERKDKKYLSKLVPTSELIANHSNLSVSSYVEKEDKRERIDIAALNKELKEVVKKEEELRRAIDRIVEELDGNNS